MNEATKRRYELGIEVCPWCHGEGGEVFGFTGDDAGSERGALSCVLCDGCGEIHRDEQGEVRVLVRAAREGEA